MNGYGPNKCFPKAFEQNAKFPPRKPREKSPPKPGLSASKGMMTSTGPVIRGPRCLLTYKDYAVKEVKTLIKSTDVDPYAELGTEELGESTLFYLTQVSSLPWLILSCLFLLFFSFSFSFLTNDYTFLQALVRV